MTPLSPQPHQSDPRRQPAALLKDLANISVHDTSCYINIRVQLRVLYFRSFDIDLSLLQKKGPWNFLQPITSIFIPLSYHHQPISICYGGSTIGRGSMSIIGRGLTSTIMRRSTNMTNRRGPIRATISAGGLCLTLRVFFFFFNFNVFFPHKIQILVSNLIMRSYVSLPCDPPSWLFFQKISHTSCKGTSISSHGQYSCGHSNFLLL